MGVDTNADREFENLEIWKFENLTFKYEMKKLQKNVFTIYRTVFKGLKI